MVLALTTKETVKVLRDIAGTELDAVIDLLIGAVSQEAEDFMNRHTLSVQRDSEIYELPAGNRYLFLRGFPLVSVTSVKYATSRSFMSIDALETATYDAIAESGELYFRPDAVPRWSVPGFVEVSYLGGMAATTTAFAAAYPSIAMATATEVVNRLNRRMTPEGNLKSLDTGVAFEKPVERLKIFTDACGSRRRVLL